MSGLERTRTWLALCLVALLAVSVLPASRADDVPAGNPPAGAQDDAEEESTASLGGMIIKSGWIGIPFYIFLGILSLVATTVALERLFRLVLGPNIPEPLVTGLTQLTARGEDDPADYRRLCEANPSPIASVLQAGLVRSGHPLLEVEKAMEDAMSREIGDMRARHQPLNVVGSIAPLVGLLGTVVGMIFAFYQSSQAGLGKAEVLAEYIYLALITTALGLSVAIPSLLLAAWYNARVDRLMRDSDRHLLDMVPIFIQMEREAEVFRRSESNDANDTEDAAAPADASPARFSKSTT